MPVSRQFPIPVSQSLAGIKTDQFGYKVTLFLWFLYLFEPARFIAYYVRVLGPLKWIPTILLCIAIFHWIRSPLKKYSYKWFALFLMVNLLGTGIAFIEGNWGFARQVNRQIFQFFMMGMLTFTFFNDNVKIEKLFTLYLYYIFYYAAWGILSLKVSPLVPGTDPGARVIVPWHHQLDNRDAFGPLMVIGLAYCFYYYQTTLKQKLKRLALASGLLCLGGVVLSFGRGVFLAMGTTLIYIWLQSKKKLVSLFSLILVAGLLFIAADIIAPGKMYWETISTISEGTKEGTGADREVLWGWAWREYINNPIFGVGTANFGVALPRYVSQKEASEHGYTEGRLWARSLHCAPLSILSEYGTVGSLVFIFLLVDFLKTNRRSRRISSALSSNDNLSKRIDYGPTSIKGFHYFSLGVMVCFVAFWVNGIFYEIIYVSFFWHIIILNRLLYINAVRMKGMPSRLQS